MSTRKSKNRKIKISEEGTEYEVMMKKKRSKKKYYLGYYCTTINRILPEHQKKKLAEIYNIKMKLGNMVLQKHYYSSILLFWIESISA